MTLRHVPPLLWAYALLASFVAMLWLLAAHPRVSLACSGVAALLSACSLAADVYLTRRR